MKNLLLKAAPHVVAVLVFAAISAAFFSPAFDGYELRQGDIDQFLGMSKEVRDFKFYEDQESLWTNSMFSGMPAFQISMQQHNNLPLALLRAAQGVFPRSVGALFIAMLSFYIFGLCMRVNPWLSMVGGIAFGLATVNVLYLGAGHMSKVTAISLMPAVLGGVIYAFRRDALIGAAITALFLGMQLASNHLQMTYYLMLLVGAVVLTEIIGSILSKEPAKVLKPVLLLVIAALLAIAPNTSNLLTTYAYSKESTRGKSELSAQTLEMNGISSSVAGADGLNKDYILEYSMSRGEFWSMMIPNIKGGQSGAIGADKELLQSVDREHRENVGQSNRYWGDQAFTGGAFYFGALIVALFLIGLIVWDDRLKWPFLVLTVLSVLLSWKNPSFITDLFLDYVPMFAKFRDTKMMLVLVQVVAPIVAILLIQKVIEGLHEKLSKQFLFASGGVVLVFVLFAAVPNVFFDFISTAEVAQFDDYRLQVGGSPEQEKFLNGYIDALVAVRENIFRADVMRSLLIVVVGLVVLFLLHKKKLPTAVGIGVLGLVVLADLYSVNRRYFDNEKVGREYARWVKSIDRSFPFEASPADMAIFQEATITQPEIASKAKNYATTLSASLDEGGKSEKVVHAAQFAALNLSTNFRVLNIRNPFSDARTSYFHKSLGGYHGAKLKRYQELIDFHLGPEIQRFMETANTLGPDVLRGMQFVNMLNARYLILDPSSQPLPNPYAFGNAWFVQDVEMVDNADAEMETLFTTDLRTTAVVDKRFEGVIETIVVPDSTAEIVLSAYTPNALTYTTRSQKDQVAVFSEIYYEDGWQAYLDGEPVPHARANYVLRAMNIPAGEHKIEFLYQSEVYATGERTAMIASSLLAVFLLFAGFMTVRKARQPKEA
ncbi:MAG: hypothetical protein RL226_1324 [Bacteroidota bacterium]